MRKNSNMSRGIKQKPGELYIFVYKPTGEKHVVRLPRRRGISNKDVIWHSWGSESYQGNWDSRKFRNIVMRKQRIGKGPAGVLGRMARILADSRKFAKQQGHLPANITLNEMLSMWKKQNNKCAACRRPLRLFESEFDHNHKTGEPRGFLHRLCNRLEGELLRLKRGLEDVNLTEFSRWYRRTH